MHSKNSPHPGIPVRGSKTGQPVMALLDLLGQRTMLRILWELREDVLTFRALQEAAATNPSVLNARLKELRAADIVELYDEGYGLTDEGQRLVDALMPLSSWANRWASRIKGN